ncbi:MAG TPA: TraB/GumN family protein [Chthoniobacterales bacterium]|nr:TraB/GumN family protein [Chthoniobacterales bacterium]
MNHPNLSPWRSPRLWLFGAVAAPIVLALPAQAEPAMWVIRDKDSTVYLIGTLHLLRHEMEWNAAKVKKTLTESTALWLELANIDDQASIAPIIARHGIDREKTLSSKLSTAQKEKLTRVAATYNVPLASLEPMKPWMAAMMFAILPLQKAGYDPNAGVDRLLKAQAEKEGDKIHGFETAEEQVRFFAEMPEAEQIAFLEETLGDAEEGLAQLEKLAKAWIAGDNETIGSILVNEFKNASPAVYEKLLVKRNIAWSKKIAEILQGSGVQQIAVGAAHLAGPDSLQVQLQKRGIKVERY